MSTVSQEQSTQAGSIVELIDALKDIDTTGPQAKINEESIDDNNGGGIIL